jgi:hypothetical protein
VRKFDELARLMDLAKYPPPDLLLARLHRESEALAALDKLIASPSGAGAFGG